MAEKQEQAKPKDGGQSRLVRVKVHRAIAFGGVAIRPAVKETRPGVPPQVTPVEAIIPRAVARAHGPKAVEIISDAPDDAKVGPVKQD